MSIEVSCKSCQWKGTVDDSLAGEVMACRSCAEPIPVPKHKSDSSAGFEVVDGTPPKIEIPQEVKEEDPVRAAKARRKEAILRQFAPRPDERKWWIPPKVTRIVGLLTAFAGLVTLIVDTILTHWSAYPFVLLIVGGLIALIGHMMLATAT